MRNFWTEQTVNRNADRAGFSNPQEYLLAKKREFEADSGVRWSVVHGGGGYTFHPVDEGVPVPADVPEGTVSSLRTGYMLSERDFGGYVTYLAAHETTDIPLFDLMGVVRWMERQGMARRTVDRMGKGYAFKLVGRG